MSSFDLVIRGGTVVTAGPTGSWPTSGCATGAIVALGDSLDRGEEELDASGKLVLPGGIDSHVHLDQPSPETGARSAQRLPIRHDLRRLRRQHHDPALRAPAQGPSRSGRRWSTTTSARTDGRSSTTPSI